MVGEVGGGGRWGSVRESCAERDARGRSYRHKTVGAKKTRGAGVLGLSIAASEDVLSEAVKERRRGVQEDQENDFLATEMSFISKTLTTSPSEPVCPRT